MNRAEKRRQRKKAGIAKSKTPALQQSLGRAIQHHQAGDLPQAEGIYQQILQTHPNQPVALHLLGVIAHQVGKNDIAVDLIGKALAVNPDFAEAHGNLGAALMDLGRPEDAVTSFRKALVLKPDYAKAHNNLGNAFKELGNLDEATANYRQALDLKPDYAIAHSNLLIAEQYRPGHNAETLFELHCEWDERHGRAFRADWPAHGNTPEAARRLRLGFVSPDLGRHPVGYFVVPLLENLPGLEFETVCYSDRIGDDLTGRIQAAAGAWRETRGVSDEDLGQMIVGDGIDILIDLSGHSARNRLLVFAHKPAPLQVTWAGYVGTTGLSAIDYLVSDRYSTAADEEPYCREKVIRMPDGYVCYDPPDYAPKVGPLPSKRKDGITFCSFNNPAKINEDVVSVWARILGRVAGARLLIKYKGIDSIAYADRLAAMFKAEGVERSRLMLEGLSPHAELLARYNDVDIALDPFLTQAG